MITTDYGYNLLGTAVNNATNDPTPGPGDVFNDKPGLAALGNYGGPTQTLALLAGSPAIGAGNASATNPATDQRGLPRVVNGSLDIGAFQTQPANLGFHDARPDGGRRPADGRHHGRAGRPGRQPGPGGRQRWLLGQRHDGR